jgi:hypothetical protein
MEIKIDLDFKSNEVIERYTDNILKDIKSSEFDFLEDSDNARDMLLIKVKEGLKKLMIQDSRDAKIDHILNEQKDSK